MNGHSDNDGKLYSLCWLPCIAMHSTVMGTFVLFAATDLTVMGHQSSLLVTIATDLTVMGTMGLPWLCT